MPEHSKVKFCFLGLSGILLNIFNPQLVESVDVKLVDMEDCISYHCTKDHTGSSCRLTIPSLKRTQTLKVFSPQFFPHIPKIGPVSLKQRNKQKTPHTSIPGAKSKMYRWQPSRQHSSSVQCSVMAWDRHSGTPHIYSYFQLTYHHFQFRVTFNI